MKIAIDARFANMKVGIGRVAYNLTTEILLLDNKNQYIILLDKDDPFKEIKKDNVIKLHNKRALKNKLLWQFVYLPYILRKKKIDVFFSTENLIRPVFFKGKTITTIHDLIPLVYKEYLKPFSPYKIKLAITKLFPPEKFMQILKFYYFFSTPFHQYLVYKAF